MGTTFVTLSRDESGNGAGFWMYDGHLEIWLRLLALHLPDPGSNGEDQATYAIRNQWLLASRGWFMGCVPHSMEDACESEEGRAVVRFAIDSLMADLRSQDPPLEASTINLLGIQGHQSGAIQRGQLIEIGQAFIDLLDGKITADATCTDFMPGSWLHKNNRPDARRLNLLVSV